MAVFPAEKDDYSAPIMRPSGPVRTISGRFCSWRGFLPCGLREPVRRASARGESQPFTYGEGHVTLLRSLNACTLLPLRVAHIQA